MNDGKGLAERLLGLDGFRVLEVTETLHEVVVTAETTVEFVGCATVASGQWPTNGRWWRPVS